MFKTRVALVQNYLQLTQEQAAQYEKVLRKYDKLRSEIRSIPADSTQKRVNKRNGLLDRRSAEIKAIFTPEQYEKYQKWTGLYRLQEIEKNNQRVDSIRGKK